MKSSAIRLPRRRFLKLKGNMVELAVGLLVLSLFQGQAAHAETLPAGDAPQNAPEPGPAGLPDALKGMDPDAIRTLSMDELKAMLDAKMLAALGLDAGFVALLDTDASAAIHRLEAAFRDKIKASAKGEAKIAAAGDAHGDTHVSHEDREGADLHHESGLLGSLTPLLLLAGLAVGGGLLLAGGGGDDDDDTVANFAPSATNDAVTTNEDTPVTFDVRTNDSDRDGGTLAVTQINGAAITTAAPVTITGGSIALGADGRLTFTPAANFNGTPTFTYTLSDGQGGTATATVNLTVNAVNDVPVANADSFTTNEDTAVTIAVRGNDTDADGNALTVTQVNGTAITANASVAITGGTVSLTAAGDLLFTPTANFNGSPTFTYTVSDGQGGTATATVSGTVTAVNDAPVNTLPTLVGTIAQGTPVPITGLSVADVDAGTAPFTTTLTVAHGTLTAGTVAGGATIAGNGTALVTLTGTLAQVNATLKAVGYTSTAGYAGEERLTISSTDGQATDTDSLALTVVQVTQGVVIDGYVAGARIFFDANGNGQYDEGEVAATTDEFGRFTLVGEARGSMIAMGGVNTDTGLPNTVVLKAPAGSTAVTPLTTLVAELVEAGAEPAAAEVQVVRALGLPTGTTLSSFDFLAADADPTLGFQVQKIATQIATVMIQAQAAGISAAAVSQQLAQAASTGAAINLGNPAQLGAILSAAGASPAAAEAAVQKAAAINQAVASATSPDKLVDTIRDLNQPDANLPPVTMADAAKFGLGISATMAVLSNDSDPTGDPLKIVAIDGQPIAAGQTVDVANGTVSMDVNGVLAFTPVNGFLGSQTFTYTVADSAGATAIGTATASLAGPILPVSADQVSFAVDHAAELAAAGVVTIDVAAGEATITEAQAQALVAAGIDFAEAGDVTLAVEGTHLNTSLKGLQALHVDVVAVAVGVAAVSVDMGGALGALSAADLPQFDVSRTDASLDVTLNVEAGTVDPALDLAGLAADLRAAGIDHLGVSGPGGLSLGFAQAQALAGAGLDFVAAADITLDVNPAQAVQIAGDPTLLAQLHVDHLDVSGAVEITEAQAAALIGAGVDFVESDDVTLAVEGTTMATSLKGLQALHVDAVAVGAGVGVLTVAAGDALDQIVAGDLPSFGVDGTDVTLTVEAGTLDSGFDMFALAPVLADAGIDHIGVADAGALGLSLQQAFGVSAHGLDFTSVTDVVVHLDQAELAGLVGPGEAALLGRIHVDTLDVIGDVASIGDDQAANLVAAGLHFAEGDSITVAAEGTQMSTSLRGLHDLKVDAVAVSAGMTKLVVDAGDLTGISASDLPQFDVAQDDEALDVTLRVDAAVFGAIGDLAQALADAGVDHIVTNLDLSTLGPIDTAVLDNITSIFGIDFAYEPFAAPEERQLDPAAAGAEADLLLELRQGYEGEDDDGTGGVYRIEDGAHHALAESGLLRAYTADTLVIDGTGSSDILHATLKDIADMGVDEVRLADGKGAPVYVELGLEGDGAGEIVRLLQSLEHGKDGPDPIFQGSDKVALVMDADAAHQLAEIDGGIEQLKAIGITEIDVLADADTTAAPAFGDAGIEVKLIGQDDELYHHLHQDR